MDSKEYYYGAMVRGIQDFIFSSDKLKEISGASEFVEQLCTTKFEDFLKEKAGVNTDRIESKKLLAAAGKIIYKLTEKECAIAVQEFPKYVAESTAGLTLSQAVVPVTQNFNDDNRRLNSRLEEARNVAFTNLTAPWMAVEKNRHNGRPAVSISNGEYLDADTKTKRKLAEEDSSPLLKKISGLRALTSHNIPYDIESISSASNGRGWIAVVHVDGNGLGQLIINMLRDGDGEKYKKFSQALDDCTKRAAQAAFKDSFPEIKEGYRGRIPLRPIVLGGDDLTVIIRADVALKFTKYFLSEFERLTQNDKVNFGDGLTACAGIAYVKDNYPFHYAAKLSEELCKKAKSASKPDLSEGAEKAHTLSSLLFHVVYASHVDSYDNIKLRELRAPGAGSFAAGPYYLHARQDMKWAPTIDDLQWWVDKFSQPAAPASQMRQLVTMYVDGQREEAEFQYKRLQGLRKEYKDVLRACGFKENTIFTDIINTSERNSAGNDELTRVSPIWDILKIRDMNGSSPTVTVVPKHDTITETEQQ